MKTAIRATLLLVALGITACDDPTVWQEVRQNPDRAILVKCRPGTREAVLQRRASIAQVAYRYGASEHPALAFFDDLALMMVDRAEQTERALQALRSDPDVEYAERDAVARALAVPDDPKFGSQWGLARIDAPSAWDVQTGRLAVVVAVIDTGIDYRHPDLAANSWFHPAALPPARGYDFANGDDDPMDDHSHGTHVAGIIGAVGNNATGVSGVCWRVQLMPLKFLDAQGQGNVSAAIAAIEAASEGGAHVINCSWSTTSNVQALQDAINAATQAGSLVVAANGEGTLAHESYPARMQNVVAVAATDAADGSPSFVTPAPWVDLSAPGTDILSTLPNAAYGARSGNSMACAHVSGLAALIKAHNSNQPPGELEAVMLQTCDDLGAPGRDDVFGQGRINAARALQSLNPQPAPEMDIASPAIDSRVTGPVQVTGVAGGPYTLEAAAPGGAYQLIANGPPTSGVLGMLDTTGWAKGWAALRLTVGTPWRRTIRFWHGIGVDPISPADGALINYAPAFDWTDEHQVWTYGFQLDDDPSFGSPLIDEQFLQESRFAPPVPDGTWWWRARSRFADGSASEYSPARSVTIDRTPPPAPVALSPDGSVETDPTPVFCWQGVSDASGVTYEIQIDNALDLDDFVPEYSASGLTATHWQPASPIPSGAWRWRVRAVDGAGNAGPWSAVLEWTQVTV